MDICPRCSVCAHGCVCAGMSVQVDVGVCGGVQRPDVPAAGNPPHGLRALTFLASDLCPSLPDGGSVDTVKSLGSSQSRILDSFIRESSFLLAMFSTRLRLVEACERQPITGLRPPPPAAVWTACGVSAGPAPPPPPLTLSTDHRLTPASQCWSSPLLLPPGCTVGVQFVLGPQTVPAGPGPSDSNARLLQLYHAAVGPADESRAPSCHYVLRAAQDREPTTSHLVSGGYEWGWGAAPVWQGIWAPRHPGYSGCKGASADVGFTVASGQAGKCTGPPRAGRIHCLGAF